MAKKINHIDLLLQDRAWSILPAKLEEIQFFIEAKVEGKDIAVPEMAQGKSGNGADDAYEIIDGVAVIPIYGSLFKRANLFTSFSGGTSYELIREDFQAALDDNQVRAIVLDIDSPGGAADGNKEVADFIYESRGQKPIIAFANGLMASAAMWIGSAADTIIATPSASVGSIGVAMTHYDFSEQDKERGIKRTVISAGKYKRISSDEKPLSEEGKEYMQSMADYLYSMFIDGIAQNRGVSAETVLEKMADGKIFIGKQALEAGLVDRIGTIEHAIQLAKEGTIMDLKELKAENKALYDEVFEAGSKSIDIEAIKAETAQKAVTSERARVVELLAVKDAPEKAKLEAIEKGLSVDASYKLFWESASTEKVDLLEKMKRSGKDVIVSTTEKVEVDGDEEIPDFVALANAMAKEEKIKVSAAMSKLSASKPELYQKWLDSKRAAGGK